jgi:hypothetical protein
MPEIAVAEDDDARCGKNDVRLAGKEPYILPEAQAAPKKDAAQHTLMASVGAPIHFHDP